MADAHKNFAVSTVATAPSPATSGTSLVVASGHGTRFPTAPFNAVICPANANPDPSNAEVVRVSGIATDTFTIARTQESTSARTVVVGDRIYAAVTAKSLEDVEHNISMSSISINTNVSVAHAGTLIQLGTGTYDLTIPSGLGFATGDWFEVRNSASGTHGIVSSAVTLYDPTTGGAVTSITLALHEVVRIVKRAGADEYTLAWRTDPDLMAIGKLTSAADKGIQFTGAGTAATYDLTTAGKALLDDADATAQRATLGVPGQTVLSDTLANRPAANAVPAGTLYYVTDIVILTRSDGSAWTAVGSPSVTAYAAKGDILIATGNDAAGIQTVGADGTILVADSAQTRGVAWKAPYSVVRADKGQIASTSVAGTYLSGASLVATAATAGQNAFYLNPADFTTAGTVKYNLRVALFTNATAPHATSITFTAGLAPVSASAGGNDINSITVGAQTSGSTVLFTTPAASTRFNDVSTDFTAPAAGYYAVSVITSATIATNARVSFTWSLLSHSTA